MLKNGCDFANVTDPCSILKNDEYCHSEVLKYNCGPCKINLDQD